jgi:hypothetical protein
MGAIFTSQANFGKGWIKSNSNFSKIHWATYYQTSAIGSPTIYIHASSPIVLGRREGCVKSLSLDERWYAYKSGEIPTLQIGFVRLS